MIKITEIKIYIRSIHANRSCMQECMPEVFNAVKDLRAKTYKTYSNFTRNHYLILEGVLCYTYNCPAHSNINS